MKYTLLDMARLGYEAEQVRQLAPLWLTLYRGPEDAQQEELAPCLAGYQPGDAFAGWLAQVQRDSVGVGIETDALPDELRKHLRRFLMVDLEGEDRKVYFRYYDPAVLRTFLPTCDAEQINVFFGPITAFRIYEAGIGQWLRFTHHQGHLQTERLAD